MLRNLLLLCAVSTCAFFAPAAQAQCTDPWINGGFTAWGQRPNGSGNTGECLTTRFGGASWGNYGANAQSILYTWVRNSRVCTDPWIGEAYATEVGRAVNGSGTSGECNTALYGSWSSFANLAANIKAYLARTAPKPVVPVAPPPPQPTGPLQVRLMTPDNQCLGVEFGSSGQGSRIIRWACTTAPDQAFTFYSDGTIHTFNGMCLDDKGGTGKQMDQIETWPCNNTNGQKWSLSNFNLRSAFNGMCINIRGGVYVGNADTILYQCDTESNEKFHWGIYKVRTGTEAPGSFIIAGIANTSGVGIVASGAGNIVASGAGNIVASGAGNMVGK